MKTLNEILETPRIMNIEAYCDSGCADVLLSSSGKQKQAFVMWSVDICEGEEIWEHVSVSMKNREPTWGEMCEVKRMFFKPEEECVQFHPKESEYVNIHKHCLHMWRNKDTKMPREKVGGK